MDFVVVYVGIELVLFELLVVVVRFVGIGLID